MVAKSKASGGADSTERKKKGVEKNRGTTDEMEILKLAVLENPNLAQRVLDKIRQTRSEAKAAAAFAEKRAAEKAKKAAG